MPKTTSFHIDMFEQYEIIDLLMLDNTRLLL